MVSWTQLLLPTLLSAVVVFIASSLIHMVIKWHDPDYRKLPNEEEVSAAIRKGGALPAQYIIPHCSGSNAMQDPAMLKKFDEGPVAVLYVKPNGRIQLGPFLGKWFAYALLIGLFAGYLGRASLDPGAPYLKVFQVVGAAAWLGYAWQGPSASIWKGQPWIVTFRDLVDGLIYAALTAGIYGWLWPR